MVITASAVIIVLLITFTALSSAFLESIQRITRTVERLDAQVQAVEEIHLATNDLILCAVRRSNQPIACSAEVAALNATLDVKYPSVLAHLSDAAKVRWRCCCYIDL